MNKMKLLTLSLFLGGTLGLQAQNTCATAITVTAGISVVDTIAGTAPTPICIVDGNPASRGSWYSYTPSQNYTIRISTDLEQNTGGDTRVMIYKGTCAELVCVAGDDDAGVIGNGYLSIVDFPALENQTYYIAFDNQWNPNGFEFELTEMQYVPVIDPPVTFSNVSVPLFSGEFRIAVADMNGDFLDDLIAVSDSSLNIHYQQEDGTFLSADFDVISQFLPNWSMAIGDIDANGFNDMVLGGGNGVTFLYANETGTDYTAVSGPQYVFSQRTNFTDLNNDGHLDVFVCHDVDPNVYYMNDGTGELTFNQGGIGDHSEGGNYGSIWVDYDNDGDSDLFIAKCRGGASTAKINELHRNNGDGTFTDVSVDANMADPLQTWSSAWNDYDNNGYMDAFIGANSFSDGHHKLMYNMGDGTFKDTTSVTGFYLNENLSADWVSFDFDNDGFADVFGGGGRISYNLGDLSFVKVNYPINFGAVGDLNNDGFLDVLNGTTIRMSSANDNNWLKLNLKGTASNINGIGARVELYSGGVKQIRDVRSGEGFKYMHTLNVHFGIGTNEAIDSVLVKWPSGLTDVVYEPEINSAVLVIEGSNPLSTLKVEGNKVVISPNPTSETLTVSHLDMSEVEVLRVINMVGQEVMTLNNSKNTIDVSAMNNGMYILQVELKNGKRYAETFIKK